MLPLFHFSVVALNVYMMWYDQMYVDIPFPAKEFEEMLLKARLSFMTFWCLIVQTVYFASAFVNDITGTNDAAPRNPPLIRKIKDTIFSLAFPCSLVVSGVFWSLYTVDKNLIFPENVSSQVPVWMNHVMHTLIVPFIVSDMLFSRITYPPRKIGLTITISFTLAYSFWINLIYFVKGHYVYPFLAVAPWFVGVFIFCVLSPITAPAMYLLCEYLHSLANPKIRNVRYSNGYSNGHSKTH